MDKFMNGLQEKLGPVAIKLDSNRYLSAIKNGFFIAMPLLIIGSMFLLVTQIPVDAYTNFMASTFGDGWSDPFMQVYNVTMNAMTLFVIIGIASELAKHYEVDRFASQAIALVAFLILTPLTATDDGTFLPLTNFGAAGLFVGMISAIIAVEIFRGVVQRGWVIRMPESVPANVATSFSALVPGTFVVVVFAVIRGLFMLTSYGTAHNFIFEVLQTPLLALGSSLPATLVVLILEGLFWSFGIHGSNIVGAVMQPIWLALTAENAAAYAAGQTLPHIVNYQFYSNFVKLGGAGATFGLALACLFFSKSSQFKTLGKLAIAPGVFNINEPLTFGVPIVLNPIMLIPYLLCPLILCLVSYVAMATGLVPLTNGTNLPWTMPPVIAGFMLCGWRGALLQVVEIGISFGLFYPFFKMEDMKAYKIEQEGAAAEEGAKATVME